ncbi:hypothetical protein EDC04DRAFT_1699104 [Pisolithus marmoratus]|nr:hypothetical protein EDC04DRAFT_1699104 [Pisolithus marmoratus]
MDKNPFPSFVSLPRTWEDPIGTDMGGLRNANYAFGRGNGANDEDVWVDPISLNLSINGFPDAYTHVYDRTWKFVYQPRPAPPPSPPPLSIPSSNGIVQPDATEGSISSGTQSHPDDGQRRSHPRNDLDGCLSGTDTEGRQTSPSSGRTEECDVPQKSSTQDDSRTSPVLIKYGGQRLFKALPKFDRIPRHSRAPEHLQGGSVPPSSRSDTQAPWQPCIPKPGAGDVVGDSRPQRVNGFTDRGPHVRGPSNVREDVVMDEGNGALSSTPPWTPGSWPARTNPHATISAPTPTRNHFPIDYTHLQHTRYTTDTPSRPWGSNAGYSSKNLGPREVTRPTLPLEWNVQPSAVVENNCYFPRKYEVGHANVASVNAPAPTRFPTSGPIHPRSREIFGTFDYHKQLKHEDTDINTLILPQQSSNNVEDTPALMNVDHDSARPTSETRHDIASIPELALIRSRPHELDILTGARSHCIPVLIWAHRDNPLCPTMPSPEYAYACLGYFFIAYIQEEVLEWNRDPETRKLVGTVQWRLYLDWAPGGEEFLLDDHVPKEISPGSTPPYASATTRLRQRPNVMRPWWCPSDTRLTRKPTIGHNIQNLRLRYYSYLPSDSLGVFHPSECSFSRGWFCRRCGLANAPLLFRHWICQSEACMTTKVCPLGSDLCPSVCSFRVPCFFWLFVLYPFSEEADGDRTRKHRVPF